MSPCSAWPAPRRAGGVTRCPIGSSSCRISVGSRAGIRSSSRSSDVVPGRHGATGGTGRKSGFVLPLRRGASTGGSGAAGSSVSSSRSSSPSSSASVAQRARNAARVASGSVPLGVAIVMPVPRSVGARGMAGPSPLLGVSSVFARDTTGGTSPVSTGAENRGDPIGANAGSLPTTTKPLPRCGVGVRGRAGSSNALPRVAVIARGGRATGGGIVSSAGPRGASGSGVYPYGGVSCSGGGVACANEGG